jgi:DNA helicase-2/ATP-dependent DNA helicase PcrA
MTNLPSEMLSELNPSQREAVEAIDGPLLIVAGPGSGKTRVITHRIAYLIQICGISNYRVLAVTFTNKAASEMKNRLGELVGVQANGLTASTFHSFCAQLLRRDGRYVGLDPNFTIFDQDDQLALVKRAMEEAELDPHQYSRRSVMRIISNAKSNLIDPHSLALRQENYFEERASRVYMKYEELLGRNNGVDFDDLLMKAVQLLQGQADVLNKYQQRYVHILIDEFQDTNFAQYALAKLIAIGHRNICVVGDPDQSIYSWRNADISNILNFRDDYPDAKTVNLEESYRSTGTILEAAKSLIASNHTRLVKDLWTRNDSGPPIIIHETYTEDEEAQFVLSEIARLKETGTSPKDCAIMYRTNAQSRALEEACLRHGMPYQLVGGVRFYQRREVKDLMCYLRLIANPEDTISLARVVNTPSRGLGQKSLEEISGWAAGKDIPLFTAMELVASGESGHPLTPRAQAAMTRFVVLIRELSERSVTVNIIQLLDDLLERISYRKYLNERGEHAPEKWENVLELRQVAQDFRDLEPPQGLHALLEQFALVSNVDRYDQTAETLTLITLHQAKGLEFPVVFLVGMEEGLLPHKRSMDDPAQVEEERRLCYVGMTRAKTRLYLLRSFRRGFTGLGYATLPSRFLRELPQHLVQGTAVKTPDKIAIATAVALPPGVPILKGGDRVHHSIFGAGMVVSCVAEGLGDYQVTVAFNDGVGVKRLLQSMAPLEKL